MEGQEHVEKQISLFMINLPVPWETLYGVASGATSLWALHELLHIESPFEGRRVVPLERA